METSIITYYDNLDEHTRCAVHNLEKLTPVWTMINLLHQHFCPLFELLYINLISMTFHWLYSKYQVTGYHYIDRSVNVLFLNLRVSVIIEIKHGTFWILC
jgi:hypothetical protein